MNCKPGDLAVIVHSVAGNEGRIVRCLELDPDHLFIDMNGLLYRAPAWRTDSMLRVCMGDMHPYAKDSQLRPIRDPGDDARDETLQWLPVPSRDEVTA